MTVPCALSAMFLATAMAGQNYEHNLPTEHPEIRYWDAALSDRLTELGDGLQSGLRKLKFDEGPLGYLPSLLAELDVQADSQILVYSKTSLQQSAISPRSPRAIYFNDEVAIGFVPGGDAIEMTALDPRQGVVMYRLANRQTQRPRLTRPKICLACHQAPATLGIPGIYVGSVLTTPSGRAKYEGSIIVDHRTPFAQRWGGWYVSPATGLEPHRGNAVAAGPASDDLVPLIAAFGPEDYLANESDVVALMTFEHQTLMTNLMIRIGWEARVGVQPARMSRRIDELVRYMLFLDEQPLPDPIRGASTFSTTFIERGPADSKGRSLRDLDLQTRLFRYTLSYMIYSRVFDALPGSVRESLYERLHTKLNAGDTEVANAATIVEILRETKPDLPRYWFARQ